MRCVYTTALYTVLFLLPSCMQGYMQRTVWQKIVSTADNSNEFEAVKIYLDTFFADHPAVKNIFTNSNKPAEFLEPRMVNTHFPDTFDPAVHVGKIEVGVKRKICDKQTNADRNALLADAGLENLSIANVVFTLKVEGVSYVVIGNDKEYGVYPMLVSRYLNALALENYLKQYKLDCIKFPKMFLYHIPGQPYEPDDSNWLVVQQKIAATTPHCFRNRCLWMQGVYDALYEQYLPGEKEIALLEGKRYAKASFDTLPAAQARNRAFYELEFHLLTKPEALSVCESLRQLKRYVAVAHKKIPDKLLHYRDDQVMGLNVLCVKENGKYVFYCIDLALPQSSDPRVNEQINKDFTGEADSFVSYDEVHRLNGISPRQNLDYLLHLSKEEKGKASLKTLGSRFELTFKEGKMGTTIIQQKEWLENETAKISHLCNFDRPISLIKV